MTSAVSSSSSPRILTASFRSTSPAKSAARTTPPNPPRIGFRSRAPIEVVDSFNASIGQGLLAIYAAELAARELDASQIVSAVRKMIPLTRTYALIGSLDYAVRGGRVKPAVKSIANSLSLSPVLASHPDGRIAPGGMLFGRRNRLKNSIRFITVSHEQGSVVSRWHRTCECRGRSARAARTAATRASEDRKCVRDACRQHAQRSRRTGYAGGRGPAVAINVTITSNRAA